MKKMTKMLSVILTVAMMAAMLVACGSSDSSDSKKSDEKTESTDSKDTIKFGTNAEFPPFEYVTQDGVIGEFDGIDIAIAKEIAEENGMEAQIENMEFDSLIVALQNGQVDAVIAGMTVTDERAEAVDFPTPYYTATQVMVVKDGSDITKASDMEGKKICVIQGYTGETCVKDLGYDYEAFKKGTEAIMELVNAIAVQKGNTELLDKINTAIEKLISDGKVSEYAAKYTDADAE